MKYFIVLIFCIAISNHNFAQQKKQILNSLIATEYAFVAAAAELGTRDAFLKFIADDGIIFRPNPINGKIFLTEAPKRPGLLSWYPIHAELSSAGDMGFTTGPAEFRKDKDSSAIWFGNFCTVWQKQPNGEWKFAIDIGNSNDKPLLISKPLEYKIDASRKSQLIRGMSHNKPNGLLTVDKQFGSLCKKNGIADTYRKFVNEKSRILRDGIFPIDGMKQIADYCDTLNISMNYKPIGGKLSLSKDFGFTYGELSTVNMSNESGERFNYMRIYKKDGNRWVIAIEVLSKIE